MVSGLIEKGNLKKLIAAVVKDSTFLGPIRTGDDVSLCEVGPDDDLALDYFNLKLPPKRLFFPQDETIAATEGEDMAQVPLPDEKVVVFGVRPCDALALLRLDKVFLDGQFADPYYRSRRDNSTIISMACAQPLETCFCTSLGTSPAGKEGADVLAFDIGDSLLFEAVTEKGEAFMKDHAGLFGRVTKARQEARDKQASAAQEAIPEIQVSQITEKLRENFESAVWDEIARRCLSCGICTYLCPTCHCFGLYDEGTGSKSLRVRVQDSCMFPSFTLEASGHNPRASDQDRMKQRIMHKFRFTVENFGDLFCVGCGRCITNCPVNIDLRETLAEVSK